MTTTKEITRKERGGNNESTIEFCGSEAERRVELSDEGWRQHAGKVDVDGSELADGVLCTHRVKNVVVSDSLDVLRKGIRRVTQSRLSIESNESRRLCPS